MAGRGTLTAKSVDRSPVDRLRSCPGGLLGPATTAAASRGVVAVAGVRPVRGRPSALRRTTPTPRSDPRRPPGQDLADAPGPPPAINSVATGRPPVRGFRHRRGVAQRPERRSPKPDAAGSTPVTPATERGPSAVRHRRGRPSSYETRKPSRRRRRRRPTGHERLPHAVSAGRHRIGHLVGEPIAGPVADEPGPDSSPVWRVLPMSCVAAPKSTASRSKGSEGRSRSSRSTSWTATSCTARRCATRRGGASSAASNSAALRGSGRSEGRPVSARAVDITGAVVIAQG